MQDHLSCPHLGKKKAYKILKKSLEFEDEEKSLLILILLFD